jgi:hypothetical protein
MVAGDAQELAELGLGEPQALMDRSSSGRFHL